MPASKPRRPPSPFAVEASVHLRDVMAEHGVREADIAYRLGRSQSYVSEHLSGVRAPDLDVLNTIAGLAGTDVRVLVLDLMGRMVASPSPEIAERAAAASGAPASSPR